ncbi:MAG: glycosyltransferase family 2 protein [Thermoflexales bacterium]
MLTVIIVSWNVKDLLRDCLRSLQQYPPAHEAMTVFVVDNASSDGTPEMVTAEFPAVRLVANPTNRGFTGGNNDGLAAAWTALGPADSDAFALLLNPDTVVTQGALEALLTFGRRRPDAGLIGPRLVYGDGSPQSSRRRFPTLATGLFESTWLQRLAPPGLLNRFFVRDAPEDRPCDVDWVVGAAMLIRWKAIDQVGGLDETNFFMYSEETDWCRRLKVQGWAVVWYPDATIIHFEAKSSDKVSGLRTLRFNTSRVRYFAKHHGRAAAAVVRAVLLAGFEAQLAVEAGKWLLGHKRGMRAERIRAYAQVIRSGLA